MALAISGKQVCNLLMCISIFLVCSICIYIYIYTHTYMYMHMRVCKSRI